MRIIVCKVYILFKVNFKTWVYVRYVHCWIYKIAKKFQINFFHNNLNWIIIVKLLYRSFFQISRRINFRTIFPYGTSAPAYKSNTSFRIADPFAKCRDKRASMKKRVWEREREREIIYILIYLYAGAIAGIETGTGFSFMTVSNVPREPVITRFIHSRSDPFQTPTWPCILLAQHRDPLYSHFLLYRFIVFYSSFFSFIVFFFSSFPFWPVLNLLHLKTSASQDVLLICSLYYAIFHQS